MNREINYKICNLEIIFKATKILAKLSIFQIIYNILFVEDKKYRNYIANSAIIQNL